MTMQRFGGAAVLVLAFAAPGPAQDAKPASHVLLTPAEAKWGDPPPSLPKGAQFLLVAGDPGKPGPFTLRLKMPAGYRIAPHWHPTDEHVTVLSGSFAVGMGEKFDAAGLKELPAGGFAMMPAQMRHFAVAKTAAVVQVHGVGPFTLNYVDPKDDPRNAAPAK